MGQMEQFDSYYKFLAKKCNLKPYHVPEGVDRFKNGDNDVYVVNEVVSATIHGLQTEIIRFLSRPEVIDVKKISLHSPYDPYLPPEIKDYYDQFGGSESTALVTCLLEDNISDIEFIKKAKKLVLENTNSPVTKSEKDIYTIWYHYLGSNLKAMFQTNGGEYFEIIYIAKEDKLIIDAYENGLGLERTKYNEDC